METTYVALLRGVNVGTTARLKMASLKEALEHEGIAVRATILQSGNLVVSDWSTGPGDLSRVVREVLHSRFAITSSVVTRTRKYWLDLTAAAPLASRSSDDTRLNVLFVDPPLTAAQWRTCAPPSLDLANTAVWRGTLVHWCPEGLSNAPQVLPIIERRLQATVTARNWRTVTRIGAALA